jgi:hypothetical protein
LSLDGLKRKPASDFGPSSKFKLERSVIIGLTDRDNGGSSIEQVDLALGYICDDVF